MTRAEALARRAAPDEHAAIEAHLRALGHGPERVAIARGAKAPEGTRWAVTVHDPGGAGLRHYLSATRDVVLAWLATLPQEGSPEDALHWP
jgi:hypothetical protein